MSELTALVVIQARLASTRLPGKLFYDIAGHRLIDHVIQRASKINPQNKIVIATTNKSIDDELADYCKFAHGVLITRGSELNVLERFKQAIQEHASIEEYFVRITADDPLRDHELTRQALLRLSEHPDAVAIANNGPRHFPLGVETEICRMKELNRIPESPRDAYIEEHVFPYFKRLGELKCLSIQPLIDHQKTSLTVDDKADAERIDRLMRAASEKLKKSSLDLNWIDVLKAGELEKNL